MQYNKQCNITDNITVSVSLLIMINLYKRGKNISLPGKTWLKPFRKSELEHVDY